MVDVEIAEAAAACPQERVESSDLIEKFADAIWLRPRREETDGAMLPIGAQQREFADLAITNAFVQFLPRMAVPAHEADADLEVLALGFLAQLEHPPCRWRINRDGLLHEDVEALLDGVAEVKPAKGRRRRQNDHVSRTQTVHGAFVGVEID